MNADKITRLTAALEMTLPFHSSQPWSAELVNLWKCLQYATGVKELNPSATTKVLCDAIRTALGGSKLKLQQSDLFGK